MTKTKRRKGYALEWFFDKILVEKPDEYDAFCVFDADNIVSKDFFAKMNDKLCKGELIVQGYRDIKMHRIRGLQELRIILLGQ